MSQAIPSGAGSGGKGLLITALTAGTAQTLHTAQTGTADADIFRVMAVNNTTAGVTVTLRFEPSDASAAVEISELIPAQSAVIPFLPDTLGFPLNDTIVVKAYADVASAVTLWGAVGTNQNTNGYLQRLHTGEITLVQNTDAFRMNGVASSATEADHQIMVPVAGVLKNLRAAATTAVGGGATATVTVRVNGADTPISVSIANAQGTNIQTDSDVIAVSAGDLVVINAATDNAGAPASTVLASVEFLPNAS